MLLVNIYPNVSALSTAEPNEQQSSQSHSPNSNDDECKLDDFASTLGKITRYSGFQPLAKLNYNADFAGGLSIVSRWDFKFDNK